jgi:hypothetical protein
MMNELTMMMMKLKWNGGKKELPIRCHVNMVFTGHEGHLLLVKTCEGKHTDLLDNMAPVTRCTFMETNKILSDLKKKNYKITSKLNKHY